MRKQGSKDRIREFFLVNIGKVVTSIQLRDAAGTSVSEWARRVRELREDEHWPILTHNDSADLRPGQYLLKEAPPEKSALRFSRPISAKLRAEVLDRNGFTCQMCGLTPSDTDPDTGRSVRLHIGHIKDKSLGGKEELSNPSERSALPATRARRISQPRSLQPFGCFLRSDELAKMSNLPY